MESQEFYNLAVKLAEDIKNIEPQLVSGSDSELCVLVTSENQAVYAGVTSVKVSAGKVMRSCPEYNAVMAMLPSGETLIEKLLTVSFSALEVKQPCEDCFRLLYRANPENQNAEIFTAPDKTVKASELFAPADEKEKPLPMAGTAISKPEKPETPKEGFAAESDASAPPPAMNKAPKNPLASANDFSGFSADGDFGFEAAEPTEEPEEEEQPAVQPADAGQANPFYQQGAAPNAAPQTMAQPYPQQYGYAAQQSQYGYAQYGYAQQSQQSLYMRQQSVYMQPNQPNMYMQPNQPNMYMQPNQPQSMYMQPNQPQSMYMQPNQPQSMYMQPNQPQSMYVSQSAAHSQQVSAYQQSNYYSQTGTAPAKTDGSTFKKRLANFVDDNDDASSQGENAPDSDLMRQAKEKKEMAKRNAFGRKK